MAKILQIRRGTTAQNNNFTGLAGELTFDTETKQVRVHDGETLGGHIIAGNSTASTGSDATSTFDITSVSDEFWESVLARLRPKMISNTEGITMHIGNNAYLEYIFDTTNTCLYAMPILVCVAADAGYNVGDTVHSFGIGDHAVMSPNLYSDTYGVHVRLFIGGQDFWVAHKTTGIQTTIVRDNWRIKFRLYYCN